MTALESISINRTERDALLKPLQAVASIVGRRHTLPVLANVLLEQKDGHLHVTATDLEMQIMAVAELAGALRHTRWESRNTRCGKWLSRSGRRQKTSRSDREKRLHDMPYISIKDLPKAQTDQYNGHQRGVSQSVQQRFQKVWW